MASPPAGAGAASGDGHVERTRGPGLISRQRDDTATAEPVLSSFCTL